MDVPAQDARRPLADGNAIPLLGLGVWQVQAYGNEESVGRALRESGVARDEVFVTTKFYPARRTHRDRIAENARLFDFTLSDEDMAELDELDRTGGTDRALERTWW